jgi:hypothetical protein
MLCVLFFDSCKKEEGLSIEIENKEVDFSIEIEKTVFNRKSGVLVNALLSGKVKSYEWKIPELDSVVSTERSFILVIPKAGNYTLQLRIKSDFGKKITKSVAVQALPEPGIIGCDWTDVGGSRFDLYIKVTGTQSNGTAYSDSVFYSSVPGSMFPNNSGCPQTLQIQVPPGQYTYWWDYKDNVFFPYKGVKTGQATIDGNCVNLH